MLLKSTFDLFDRDGGGEIETAEVFFVIIVYACVVAAPKPEGMFPHGLPFNSFALTVL